MEYTSKTRNELLKLCKEKGVKRFHNKTKGELTELLKSLDMPKKQDTGKFRTNMKDQFYTKETVAKSCIETILEQLPLTSEYLWIEPSAGNGSFLKQVPKDIQMIGLDIEPKAPGILTQDYLKWKFEKKQKCVVFGNPPFGRQSSLAKAFVSKSCEFADVIAFILPKSFTKPSMYHVFDLHYHCISSTDLEKNSFVLNGEPYDVPCVFQIWEKKEEKREVEKKVSSEGFHYVKSSEAFDIAFRRVGGLAGKCYRGDGKTFSVQSHYFLKFDVIDNLDTIIESINKHVFPSNTVGPRSLSKTEINSVLNDIVKLSA